MFPALSSLPSRVLRKRVVRGLDVAVEFATLGEYGVEEVEVEPREPAGCGWDWPPRVGGAAGACAAGGRRRLGAPRLSLSGA